MNPVSNKRVWERLWEEGAYGELMKKRAFGQEPEMEQVKQLVKLVREVYKPGMKVLDVGCGVGHFYPSLKKIDQNISYYGVDVSEHYLKLARSVFAKEKNFRVDKGDIFDLKIEDNSYDIVICYMVLPFIPNWKKAVRELARVTKKHLFIRLLLGDFTYIIKIYKEGHSQNAPYEFYNIYSRVRWLSQGGRSGESGNLGRRSQHQDEKKKGIAVQQLYIGEVANNREYRFNVESSPCYQGVNCMKFLVVGLGSMGKRRIRNLQYLKAGEIIGFDLREDRRKEAEEKYKIKTFGEFEEAMIENPAALIISTPPDLHMKYAMIAARKNKHFFTEASVVNDGMGKLISLIKGKKIVAAPSCTMRFHPAIKKIKGLVDERAVGKPLAFTYHSGQYLPDWHPWEDYRKFYVARRTTGAAREIVPFELVWLTWLLGDVDATSCLKGKVSDLDVDIDDTYQVLLKFKSGALGHMLVDVVARAPVRVFRLLGEEGTIEWDRNANVVKVFTAGEKKWEEYSTEEGKPEKGYIIGERMYIEEMERFVRAIEGKEKYPYSFEDDKKILEILYAAEKSSEIGKQISLASGR